MDVSQKGSFRGECLRVSKSGENDLRLGWGNKVRQSSTPNSPGGGRAWYEMGYPYGVFQHVNPKKGTYTPPSEPHFLWITEFPLFTRADDDKDFLAKGRWSSSHHPFTAPMWQDIEKLYSGDVASVRICPFASPIWWLRDRRRSGPHSRLITSYLDSLRLDWGATGNM